MRIKNLKYLTKAVALAGTCFFLVSNLASCQTSRGINKETINVKIESKSDSKVNGEIQILEKAPGLLTFNVNVSGLDPNSTHGIHIHEKGDCSAQDAKSAGGHYNPTNKNHGGPKKMNSHVGDLGNLKANGKGLVKTSFVQAGLALNQHTNSERIFSIEGRSIIIHEKRDDLKTNPSGASGKRIACGIIISD